MVKTLAKSIREYKRDSILTPILVSLEVLLEVIIPLMMANLIDYGIDKGDMGYIGKTGVFLLIAAFFSRFSGRRPVKRRHMLLQGWQRISGRICTIMYRIFHFLISINFPHPVL